jgi:hypothetical protein
MSSPEWVRQALDLARRRESAAGAGKLEVIRAAAWHDFPAGDMGSMLAEIESGRHRSASLILIDSNISDVL